MFKLAAISVYLTLLAAIAVQGASLASLEKRRCDGPDMVTPKCETSDASPLVNDCQAALRLVSGTCRQGNSIGSACTTLVTVGTCKVDVCGYEGAELEAGINCGGYLQTLANDCHSNNRVGGYIRPQACNIKGKDQPYRLQFSHSKP